MRKIVLVYLLMIALPAVLVALGGLHLVRREVLRLHQDEQAHAAQAGTRLVARAQKELLETARRLVAAPYSDDRLVRNTFEWTGQDGLVRPRRETATRAELDFLNRFSGFLTMRQPWLARNAPDEGWKATDHGPHGELLYWRRRGAGRVVGFELRMQEVANRLPPEKPYVADTRPVWLIGGCLVALLVLSLVGGGAGLLLFARDARRESRHKTELVTQAAHKLRTPLANIQLYAEIVKERRYETESERDEALDAVAGESRRLVEIVLDKALFGVLDQPGKESDHA